MNQDINVAQPERPVNPHRVDTRGDGFGPLVRTNGLFFCTVVDSAMFSGPENFGVYMRHGCPAGQFWRNSPPIRRFKDQNKANQFIDELAGLVDAHKAFPVFHRH